MRKNYILLAFSVFLLITIIFSSCNIHVKTDSSNNELTAHVPNEIFSSNNSNNDYEIIIDEKHYRILYQNEEYHYWLYDENHLVVDSGSNVRPLYISNINDQVIKITSQSGSGMLTQWGYYYNLQKDVRSRIFHSIHDENNEWTAYVDRNKIIIRDIFDKTKYYQEINNFKFPLSDTLEAIIDIKFLNDGKSIKVTYISGEEYNRVEETIDLN